VADRIAVTPFDTILGMAWPQNVAGWAAVAVAAVSLAAVPAVARGRLPSIPWRAWLGLWALISVACSAGYIAHYLQGGPRIIDATSYWLEARGFASGWAAWPIDAPTASFRGRFLLHHLSSDGSMHLGVIFPPGYPALLAVGFLIGTPLAVGPAIAGALTIVTAMLARMLTGRESVGRLAAVLATLNACLRYHTADTMSHGLAALLLAAAVATGVHAARTRRWPYWVLCGFLAGWLAATRPATALALAIVALPAALWWMIRARSWLPLVSLLGALPPIALLAAHQHAVTGAWLVSSQSYYYGLSDGPPGCFRYGFGQGIGCLVEHGMYVRDIAPDGFGLSAALMTTGRRIYLHLADILNYAPLSTLMLFGVWGRARTKGTVLALCMPAALIAAYMPFYFDGSYPGGGARMLADALPFEHVLVAAGLAAWARRFPQQRHGIAWACAAAICICCLGFAVHAAPMHQLLRDRDAGRPMYEPDVVRRALGDEPRGLLFVDTDHGFNLAHDPAVRDATAGLVVARARYDDRDRLLWQRLGQPPAWRYVHRPWEANAPPPRLEAWKPPPSKRGFVFEAEAEWPALRQDGGYAAPTHLGPHGCASSGRALALHRTDPHKACVTTEVPLPHPGRWGVRAWLVASEVHALQMWVKVGHERAEIPVHQHISSWPGKKASSGSRLCLPAPVVWVETQTATRATWGVCSGTAWLALDRVELLEGPVPTTGPATPNSPDY